MKITIFGTGYVGLVSAACFAETGNNVLCVDINKRIISNLKKGKINFFEPGLENLIKSNIKRNRIKFSTSVNKGINESDIFFICVGTPEAEDGSSDISAILTLAKDIQKKSQERKFVFIKSTVPVGTSKKFEDIINESHNDSFHLVASNPEFLKEGDAVNDFMKPNRIIVGSSSQAINKIALKLYRPFIKKRSQLLFMDQKSSEITKYASNSFLATKISFINELSQLATVYGANIHSISEGMGMDERIGKYFLNAGLGYGGSCFPKDINSLIFQGTQKSINLKLLKATKKVNDETVDKFIKRILKFYGSKHNKNVITVWGQSFKAKTTDIRESRGLIVAENLSKYFDKVVIYDPMSSESAKSFLSQKGVKNIRVSKNIYNSAKGSNGIVICTEWDEFKKINLIKISRMLEDRVIFDGRHVLKDMESIAKENNIQYIPI